MSDVETILKRAREQVAQGHLDEAGDACDAVLSVEGDNLDAIGLLGIVRMKAGRPSEALAAFESGLRVDPESVQMLNHAGEALMMMGRAADAIPFFRQARKLDSTFTRAARNLGAACVEQGRLEDALPYFVEATQTEPGNARNWTNLGECLRQLGRQTEALGCFDKGMGLEPSFGAGHHGRGLTLRAQGQVDEAIVAFKRALKCDPPAVAAEADLLLSLHKSETADPAEIQIAHRKWGERQGRMDTPARGGADRNPRRRLRIGYLAPDFEDAAWAPLVKPLVAAHDRTEVEVICYASQLPASGSESQGGASAAAGSGDGNLAAQSPKVRPPKGARRLHGLAGLTDEVAARRIMADRIDVLVDLMGHLPGNRAGILARQPAPVQVSWAGYPGPVGLSTVSHRLTDRVLDPETLALSAADTNIRLPGGAFCWVSQSDERPVTAGQAEANGYVTFGCRTAAENISVQTVANWSAILRSVATSKLRVALTVPVDEGVREQIRSRFEVHGLGGDRVTVEPANVASDDGDARRAFWKSVDIGLDTQPWNSLQETCAALWHGVPVLAMRGETAAGRVGASLLVHGGCGDLVAATRGQLVESAIALARDTDRLARLRRSLRERIQASPLGNSDRMARELENGYRQVWRQWCRAVPDAAEPEAAVAETADEPSENVPTSLRKRVVVGGTAPVPGWIVTNPSADPDLVEIPRLSALPMFEDGSVAEVYIPDLPEWLPGGQKLADILAEARRILAPGGKLRLSVPNREAVDALSDAQEEKEDGAAEVMRSLLGEGVGKSAALTWDDVRQQLADVGFRRIFQRAMFPDFPAESSRRVDGKLMILNVEAVRTAPAPSISKHTA